MKLLFSLKLPLKLHSLIIPSLSIPTSLLKFSPPHPPLKFPTTRFPSPKSMATAMSSPKPLVQVKDNIELTETEEKIFHRLLGTLRHFNLQTQLRVAGGWVRDKVLFCLSCSGSVLILVFLRESRAEFRNYFVGFWKFIFISSGFWIIFFYWVFVFTASRQRLLRY